ncbi:MAG: hypothetical protein ACRDWV_02875, partial [Acidimicrobiales bacterium]
MSADPMGPPRRSHRRIPPLGLATRRRAITAAVVAVVALAAVPLTLYALTSYASSFSGVLGPTSQMNLNFVNSGSIAALDVRPGQTVTAGEVVATQDRAPQALAVANDGATLSADQAQLASLEHAQGLATAAGYGLGSSVSVQLTTQIGIVQTQYTRDRANLAADQLRETQDTLTSPVAGLVVATTGTPGELASGTGVRLYQPVGASVGAASRVQLYPSSPSSNVAVGT